MESVKKNCSFNRLFGTLHTFPEHQRLYSELPLWFQLWSIVESGSFHQKPVGCGGQMENLDGSCPPYSVGAGHICRHALRGKEDKIASSTLITKGDGVG